MSWPHAAAGRLLGRHPEPPDGADQCNNYPLGWHDGCTATRRQLAARLEAAGWRGRLAASLLEDGRAVDLVWLLAGSAVGGWLVALLAIVPWWVW